MGSFELGFVGFRLPGTFEVLGVQALGFSGLVGGPQACRLAGCGPRHRQEETSSRLDSPACGEHS